MCCLFVNAFVSFFGYVKFIFIPVLFSLMIWREDLKRSSVADSPILFYFYKKAYLNLCLLTLIRKLYQPLLCKMRELALFSYAFPCFTDFVAISLYKINAHVLTVESRMLTILFCGAPY